MKAVLPEEYYRMRWNQFLEWVPGEHYINLEGELQRIIERYISFGMPEIAIQVVRKEEAKKLAERCEKLVRKEMATIKEINAGQASFGMTTRQQEYSARADFVRRFEFNCLQLRDFRKAYGV